MDGISRFTLEMIRQLAGVEQHNWFLYSHKPALYEIPDFETRYAPKLTASSTLAAQTNFLQWIKKDRIDVFWSPRHHLPLLSRVKSIVTIHDLCWRFHPHTMPATRRCAERIMMPPSARQAEVITTPTQSVADEVRRTWPHVNAQIHVIRPGRQTATSPAAYTDRPHPYLLAVGTQEPRKNYPLLVAAFAQIAQEIDHNLVVVGRQGVG